MSENLESIFDLEPDAAAEACLDSAAEADIAAGRVVPHEEVVRWLRSRGTANELSCPRPRNR